MKCTLIKYATHGFVVERDSKPSESACAICRARGMNNCEETNGAS
ncbi:MAG: hypothetical protein N2738_06920 [Thermodesulfovibrionales bacterium]|nr:hypothetical protein [Thermodesulfovibrionales bacterium]